MIMPEPQKLSRPANIVLSKHGQLVDGCFYELITSGDTDSLQEELTETPNCFGCLRPILEGRGQGDANYLYATLTDYGGVEVCHNCSENEAHVTEAFYKSAQVQLSLGPHHSSFHLLDDDGGFSVLVTKQLASQLVTTDFSGYRLETVEIEELIHPDNYNKYEDPGFRELQFRGKMCFRPLSVVGAPN